MSNSVLTLTPEDKRILWRNMQRMAGTARMVLYSLRDARHYTDAICARAFLRDHGGEWFASDGQEGGWDYLFISDYVFAANAFDKRWRMFFNQDRQQ